MDPASEPIRLQTYVNVLAAVADGNVDRMRNWPEKSTELRAAKELLRAGLISEGATSRGILATFIDRLVVTPEGALVLMEWQDYLGAKSMPRRVWRIFYQWLLVLAGGAAGIIATRIWPPG